MLIIGQNIYAFADDLVHTDDEVFLDEYVLNDTGIIYTGNSDQIGRKPWSFGQFEDNVLDCSLYLLDTVGLKNKVRGDPIHVARSIAAIVCIAYSTPFTFVNIF